MLRALALLGLVDMQLRSATRQQAAEQVMGAAGPSTPRAKSKRVSAPALLVSPYFQLSSQAAPPEKVEGRRKAVRKLGSDVPPTPDSLPRKKTGRREAVVELNVGEGGRPKPGKRRRRAQVEVEVELDPSSTPTKRSRERKGKDTVHGEITQGGREEGKIHLIQGLCPTR